MEFSEFYKLLSERNDKGETYFHMACQKQSISDLRKAEEWMKKLNQEIINKKDDSGAQCIHILALSRDSCATDMMDLVLQLGADVNGQEELVGNTPLHICVKQKNYVLAEFLCQQPAINLKAENYTGKTPFHLARKMQDPKMMSLLRKYETELKPSVKRQRKNSI